MSNLVTVVFVEKGLETSFEKIFILPRDLEAYDSFDGCNCNICEVEFSNMDDANRGIAIQQEILELNWTPNQDQEEREENKERVNILQEEFNQLLLKKTL